MTIKLADGRNELWQWDTGRKVVFDDETVKQAHFQNHSSGYGRTIDVDVEDGAAKIPDELLQAALPLTVYAYVGEELDGYTKIERAFTVKPRKRPAEYVFTPTEQLTLRQLEAIIGDLNNLTTKAKENLVAAINEAAKTGSGGAGSIDLRTADGYIQYSNDGGETWENLIALADLKGEKGDTGAPGPQGVPGERGPQGETGPQGPQGKTGPAGQDGAPGKDGSPGKDGTDGAPGQDGFSPSASVAKTATGATITITDKTGTTTAEIKNGKDGAPGKDGTNGAPGTPGKDGTDGKDGTTFTPSVSAAGDLSWTNDGGKANPAPVNLKGPPGADYTLTDADKTEIAAEAAAAIAGTSLPAPASAAVGQIVKIKAVDAAGKITETEAVDMPSGGTALPKFEEIYTHTITAEEAEKAINFIINANDVPNIGEYNAFVLTLEHSEDLVLTKWVRVYLNGTNRVIAQITGANRTGIKRYGAAFNRCFQKWCGSIVYKMEDTYTPTAIAAPYGADYVIDNNDDAQAIKWGSYATDFGLVEGIVVRLYAAK